MENVQEANAYFADIIENAQPDFLNSENLAEALSFANQQNLPLVEVLVERKFCSRREIVSFLADFFVMDAAFPLETEIPPDAIAAIPGELARKYRVLPMYKRNNMLGIAIADPLRFEAVDHLKLHLHLEVEPLLAMESDIEAGLKKYYSDDGVNTAGLLKELRETEHQEDNVEFIQDEEEGGDDDAPVIKLVSLIIIEAFKNRASDIHFEPLGNRFRVRYRIDGLLHEVSGPPKRLQASVISRLKIMAGMSIAERRLPQDGRIKLNILSREIDLRVSSIPIVYGESIVLRILDKSGVLLGMQDLGFSDHDMAIFDYSISRPNGIFLITGPTGSGKTSTLYSALSHLNKPNRKIITVEDPIEYQLNGINQVQINEPIGRTFAGVLRSMLRQAPNIIMVGEIRDTEVANIAINAALTGHLVFSTLHTNDAPSSISRLIDQGVKPYLVASTLQAVLAQRLVRVICPECKEPVEPKPQHLIGLGLDKDRRGITFYRGKGCNYCSGTGYRGRCGIFELLQIDDHIRELIYARADSHTIKQRAIQLGMRTLLMDGIEKIVAGRTSAEEVFRVTQA